MKIQRILKWNGMVIRMNKSKMQNGEKLPNSKKDKFWKKKILRFIMFQNINYREKNKTTTEKKDRLTIKKKLV